MFIGQYNHNIDAKGRIIVPARFREELGDKVIICKWLDGCLAIYTQDQWEKLLEQLVTLPSTMREARIYQRTMLANATEEEFDSQGRVLLPSSLIKEANIAKECVFIGVGDHVECWAKESWEAFQKTGESDFESVAEKLTEYLR